MEPWQERVVAEKRELDARIHRLRAVLERDDTYALDYLARDLMQRQLAYMLAYSSTLRDRIENFKPTLTDAASHGDGCVE